MKTIILEKSLDFKQFQNLIILTFVTSMTFLGITYSEEFETPNSIKITLGILTLVFIAILFTKKGLLANSNNLYTGIFLFGFTIKKKSIDTSNYQELTLRKGKLSTNYAYSYNITEFHNWEPDLNHSVDCFTLGMENETKNQKIIVLTKPKKVILAIDFIKENSNLSY